MLANPHWNAPSLSSFESWLEIKDPQEKYRYSDCTNCAVAQYLKHVNKYNDRWLADSQAGDTMQTMNRLAADSLDIGNCDSLDPDHSFGALLNRVRAHRQFETV